MKKTIHPKFRTLSIVTALCTALGFSAVATAHNFAEEGYGVKHEKQWQPHGDRLINKMIKVLDLTEEQQIQIKAIKIQAKEQRQDMREIMKEFKAQAKALVQAETFDEQAFTALQSSYQANFEQAGLQRAKTKNAIFNVLNEEQQEKWQKIMERKKAKFKKFRGL